MTVEKERVYYADVLRILAIVLVAAVHVLGGWYGRYYDTNRPVYGLLIFCGTLCSIAVPSFLMLTGAFMLSKPSHGNYWSYFKKRVLNLLIPFLGFSLLYYWYAHRHNLTEMSLLEFIENFTTGNVMYHFWFMYIILLVYLFIPFLSPLVHKISRSSLRTLIIVLSVTNVLKTVSIFLKYFDQSAFDALVFPDFFVIINYTLIGYYLFHYDIAKSKRRLIYGLGALSAMVALLLDVALSTISTREAILSYWCVTPMLMSMAVFLFLKYNCPDLGRSKIWKKILSFLVPLVFYIYMIHVLVMDRVLLYMLPRFNPRNFVEICGFMAVELAAILGISCVGALITQRFYMACCSMTKRISHNICRTRDGRSKTTQQT